MFKRVIVENWALCLPAVSFVIFFTVFAVVTIRALRIGRAERERLAAMPLESGGKNPTSEH
jgi:hypothetical protein